MRTEHQPEHYKSIVNTIIVIVIPSTRPTNAFSDASRVIPYPVRDSRVSCARFFLRVCICVVVRINRPSENVNARVSVFSLLFVCVRSSCARAISNSVSRSPTVKLNYYYQIMMWPFTRYEKNKHSPHPCNPFISACRGDIALRRPPTTNAAAAVVVLRVGSVSFRPTRSCPTSSTLRLAINTQTQPIENRRRPVPHLLPTPLPFSPNATALIVKRWEGTSFDVAFVDLCQAK